MTLTDYLQSIYGQPMMGPSDMATPGNPALFAQGQMNAQQSPAQSPQQPGPTLSSYLADPAIQRGLLAMGAQLLRSSGPSRMPTTLGQALGSGAMVGMNATDAYRQQQAAGQQQQLNNAMKYGPQAMKVGNTLGTYDPVTHAFKPIYQGASTSTAEQWHPITAAERQKYNIAANDPNSWVVSSTGDIKIAGGSGYGTNPAELQQAASIGQSIIDGQQPPDMKGLYRQAAPVKAYLADHNYNLTKASQDWMATQKLLSTMNGAQQTRLRQAINQVDESLPLVQDLATKWDGGQFPILNKANLIAAKNGVYGPDAQSIATQLDAEIADVTSELGTVYKGGNSSTDESLKLAASQLNSGWSRKTLMDAIQLAQKNIRYRKNSLSLATAGIPVSQYNPGPKTPAQQAGERPSQPANAAPDAAIQYLKAHPETAQQFKAKYGYLPQ
ncbi:MAG: hypothetical protein ACREHG_04070 [Candidatus Saccharimonadales bacterium]